MGGKLLFILMAAVGVHAAGDSALDRATLRGIEGVNVVVDPVDPQVENAGVTRADLLARVETRLRSRGIMVDTSRPEFLAVRMSLAHSGRGPFAMFAVALTLGFYQPVELVRDPKVRTATQTWEVETVILSAPKSLDEAVLDSIDDLTDRFVKAHRSVNQAP